MPASPLRYPHHRIARPANGQTAPKYLELANRLLRQIAAEGLRPGDRLGTEQELGRKHKASRFTVRHALAILAQEGYISREKARGTFVRKVSAADMPCIGRGTLLVVCSSQQASHAREDFAFSTVLRAMERTLAREGYAVQILSLGDDFRQDQSRLAHLLRDHQLKGILTIGPCLEPYRHLLDEVPVVYTGYFYPPVACTLVGDDVRSVCRNCVDYLIRRGHRRVAVMCGPGIDPQGFGLFAQGYRDACAAHGLPAPRQLLYHAYPGEPLVELAASIMTAEPRPTAIVGENWRVCEAILAAARELNIRIPADLSLVGYGQNVLHVSAPVGITAYVPDSEGIGARAAELLVKVVDGEAAPDEPVLLPGRLIERESVAPPPSTPHDAGASTPPLVHHPEG